LAGLDIELARHGRRRHRTRQGQATQTVQNNRPHTKFLRIGPALRAPGISTNDWRKRPDLGNGHVLWSCLGAA
jgi:hypothetical protein